MMKRNVTFQICFCFILIIGCLSTYVYAQTPLDIEGKILDNQTNEPIAYATIYNKNTQKGTISNQDGYFRIRISDISDTLTVSLIGYKMAFVKLRVDQINYLIFLEANILLLNEVSISPKDNLYLYAIVDACKQSISNKERKSKAYYELKSFVDDKQIELVEGYYNLDIKGYKLTDLHLKAGRVALRTYNNRVFTSLESSRALLELYLFDRNEYFPINPMELSKSNLKKYYNLRLENKYINEENDSIYVIEYLPIDTSGLFFYGKLWLNKSRNSLLKITLHCDQTTKHPFLPLFSIDKISKVGLYITQTYTATKDQVILKQADFNYNIHYTSRVGKYDEQSYIIMTRAILYAYDYDTPFRLPFFTFKDKSMGDYRKINAMPYNDFFWHFNDEYRLNDSMNINEFFFTDSTSLTNKSLFTCNTITNYSIFEHPFISWSKNRIQIRDILQDTSELQTSNGFISEQYKLAVKIYLDIDTYGDSTHIITSTVMDPFESFYHLPIDKQTHCFINIYFDLCEIARRELEEKLKSNKLNDSLTQKIYDDYMAQHELKMNAYLNAVERGTNEQQMILFNNIVFIKLGIDNLNIFQPFKK